MLIALSGLPGTGKTTVSRLLAVRLPAVHVRVDTIEQALLRSGFPRPVGAEGYVVAYGIAADNLRLGHHVVADCVNAAQVSREAWEGIARGCGVAFLPVHLVCSDLDEHRRRIEGRRADIEGHVLPTWQHVAGLRLDPPPEGGLTIDTSACSVEAAVKRILRRVN